MSLWFVFALMTAAAIFAVLWPLGRGTRGAQRAGTDIAVYRDQLEEIARNRAAGLIGESEAEAARVEVSRRLIAAADSQVPDATASASGGTSRRRACGADRTPRARRRALPQAGLAAYARPASRDPRNDANAGAHARHTGR